MKPVPELPSVDKFESRTAASRVEGWLAGKRREAWTGGGSLFNTVSFPECPKMLYPGDS